MSEWKQDAARRRDARNGGPVPHTKARPTKDRKRWCGGRAGREHKPVARPYCDVKRTLFRHPEWWLLICTTCGKELDRYWPMNFTREDGSRIEPEPPPSWVPITEGT